MTTLRALGVLKQEEWVIIFTNCGSDSCCDSVGLKAAKTSVGNFQLVALIWYTLKTCAAYATNKNWFVLIKSAVSLGIGTISEVQFNSTGPRIWDCEKLATTIAYH